MIAVLIIAICAAVHEPTGLRLICRADRSEPMPVAQCETARASALERLKGAPMLSGEIQCIAPGDPA